MMKRTRAGGADERRAAGDAGTRGRPAGGRVLGGLRSALLTLGAVLGGASILLVVAGALFGIRPLVVVSGSMEPSIPTGSLILVRTVPAADLAVGDVATVPRPDGAGTITHRIVEISPEESGQAELVLRGDANTSPDPLPYRVAEAGRLILTLPYMGAAVEGLRTPLGLTGVGVLLIGLVLLYAIRPPGEPRDAGPDEPAP